MKNILFALLATLYSNTATSTTPCLPETGDNTANFTYSATANGFSPNEDRWYAPATDLFDCSEPLQIDVSPNPCNDYVNVTSNQPGELYLYNTGNDLLIRKRIMRGQNTIETTALPAGLYYLLVYDDCGNMARKVVVRQ